MNYERRKLNVTERICENRLMQVNKRNKGIIYLRCNTNGCHGTAKVNRQGVMIPGNGHGENCFPQDFLDKIIMFKKDIKDTLRRQWRLLRELYDEKSLEHPIASSLLSYQTLRQSMKRWRNKSYPNRPTSIEDFATQIMQHIDLLKNIQELQYKYITINNKKHLAFYSKELCEKMKHTDEILIDGTFRTTPRMIDAYQLVSILGVKDSHVIPFFWIVMSDKSEESYYEVLKFAQREIFPENRIQLCITDFEQGLRNACQRIFLNAIIGGCNVHFDRCVYRKLKNLKLQYYIKENDVAREFIKKLLALAFLPADEIISEYEILKGTLPVVMKNRLSVFLNYFQNYWLTTVTPKGFSIFGLDRRTNNAIESYHAQLGHKLETHPSPWDFLCKLQKLAFNALSDIARLANRQRISRLPRYKSMYKKLEIEKEWINLITKKISRSSFVERIAGLKGAIPQRIEAAEEIHETDERKMITTPDVNDNISAKDFNAKLKEVIDKESALAAVLEQVEIGNRPYFYTIGRGIDRHIIRQDNNILEEVPLNQRIDNTDNSLVDDNDDTENANIFSDVTDTEDERENVLDAIPSIEDNPELAVIPLPSYRHLAQNANVNLPLRNESNVVNTTAATRTIAYNPIDEQRFGNARASASVDLQNSTVNVRSYVLHENPELAEIPLPSYRIAYNEQRLNNLRASGLGNTSIETRNVGYNPIDEQRLSNARPSGSVNTSITTTNITHNPIDEQRLNNVRASRLVNTSIETRNVAYNPIDEQRLSNVRRSGSVNTSITTTNITYNPIDEQRLNNVRASGSVVNSQVAGHSHEYAESVASSLRRKRYRSKYDQYGQRKKIRRGGKKHKKRGNNSNQNGDTLSSERRNSEAEGHVNLEEEHEDVPEESAANDDVSLILQERTSREEQEGIISTRRNRAEEFDSTLCIVCVTGRINVSFPCQSRHSCCCMECALTIMFGDVERGTERMCPLCREKFPLGQEIIPLIRTE